MSEQHPLQDPSSNCGSQHGGASSIRLPVNETREPMTRIAVVGKSSTSSPPLITDPSSLNYATAALELMRRKRRKRYHCCKAGDSWTTTRGAATPSSFEFSSLFRSIELITPSTTEGQPKAFFPSIRVEDVEEDEDHCNEMRIDQEHHGRSHGPSGRTIISYPETPNQSSSFCNEEEVHQSTSDGVRDYKYQESYFDLPQLQQSMRKTPTIMTTVSFLHQKSVDMEPYPREQTQRKGANNKKKKNKRRLATPRSISF